MTADEPGYRYTYDCQLIMALLKSPQGFDSMLDVFYIRDALAVRFKFVAMSPRHPHLSLQGSCVARSFLP